MSVSAITRENNRGEKGQGEPAHGRDSCRRHWRGRRGGECRPGQFTPQCSARGTIRVRLREPGWKDRLSAVPHAAAASVLALWRDSVALGGLARADSVSRCVADSDFDSHADSHADGHRDCHHDSNRDSHRDAYQLTIASQVTAHVETCSHPGAPLPAGPAGCGGTHLRHLERDQLHGDSGRFGWRFAMRDTARRSHAVASPIRFGLTNRVNCDALRESSAVREQRGAGPRCPLHGTGPSAERGRAGCVGDAFRIGGQRRVHRLLSKR
jgi:hypothetical protein